MTEKELSNLHPAEAGHRLLEFSEEEAAEKVLSFEVDFAAEALEALDPWQ
ncbi:MAG: hypothetical protein ABEI54_02200, partial [Candidatus Bipolaricaulia bacterium]